MKNTRKRPEGFNATALQVHRAYVSHFGHELPDDITFSAAADELVKALGHDRAREFIQGQSNDPRAD